MGQETTEVQGGVPMPDDLKELNDKGLESLQKKIQTAFDRVNAKERVSAEDLVEMETLAGQMKTVKAEGDSRAAAGEEAQARRAAIAAEMAGETEPEAPTVEEAGGDVPPEPETPAEPETPPAPAEETPAEPEPETPAEPEALAASARGGATAKPRSVPESATRPVERWGDPLSITASSDIPGFSTGSPLTRESLGEALHARARGLSDGRGSATQYPVASIALPKPHVVTDKMSDGDIMKVWNEAHDVQSLVASGGWCAPSETIYDFVCDFEAVDGLVDLPGVTATRGGLRFPTSPLLKDVFADSDSGFTWTEADDIAAAEPGGPTKPCFVIPCPEFNDIRLQAQGLCVTAGNLTDKAFPELTNRYIDLVMAAHAHRINGLTIAKMVAGSTAFPVTEYPNGGATAVLPAVEFVIQSTRDSFFMAENQVLEVVAPRWLRGLIRGDIARRNGVDFTLVSNAQIDTWFAEIGASVQFVADWQSLTGAETEWPEDVTLMVYPAGAHTRLDGGSIDLGVVRDSTLNATNDYTAAWTEEFWQVLTRCASFTVDIPVCASGVTTAAAAATCPVA